MATRDLPEIVPPGTKVRLARCDDTTPAWKGREGATFTIGYYCRSCGPSVIWLVDEKGRYAETVDRQGLLEYFDILSLGGESDVFGESVDPAHDV